MTMTMRTIAIFIDLMDETGFDICGHYTESNKLAQSQCKDRGG